MRPIAIALMMGLAVATQAGAAKSDRDKFEDTLHRVAPLQGTFNTTGKSRTLCVCKTNERAGVVETLHFAGDHYIQCMVPTFNSSGDLIASTSCSDWMPVAK
ncbi:hypothetical protein K2Z84_19170 [Candidatus Binatia bacterium]|jgi:hypothetical protein|nr:hypothetical protein [Candidatus Binatia bacterium]